MGCRFGGSSHCHRIGLGFGERPVFVVAADGIVRDLGCWIELGVGRAAIQLNVTLRVEVGLKVCASVAGGGLSKW